MREKGRFSRRRLLVLGGPLGAAGVLAAYEISREGGASALVDAVAGAKDAGGGRIVFPEGTFDLTGFTATLDEPPITFEGIPGRTVLDFGGQAETGIFTVATSLTMRGLTVRNAGRLAVLDPARAVDSIDISDCIFLAVGGVVYAEDPEGGLKRLHFHRNYVNGSLGPPLHVRPDILGSAAVTGNAIHNVVRAGILLGRGDAVAQVNRGRYYVAGNRIKGVTGASDANGIQVFGDRAQIIGNSVEDCSSDDNTDCEAIYTKVTGAVIVGNTMRDAGGPQGAIAIKGTTRAGTGSGAYGYGSVAAHNTIRFTDDVTRPVSGIWVQEGDVLVSGNYIEGATSMGITVDSDVRDRVHIRGNHLYGIRGNNGIQLKNSGEALVVDDNVIAGVTNAEAKAENTHGIVLAPTHATALKGVSICNNRISGIGGEGSGGRGIQVRPEGDSSSIIGLRVCGNHIDGVDRGLDLSEAASTSDVWIDGNSIRAGAAVSGQDTASLVAWGSNNFAAGVVTVGAPESV